MSSAVCLNLDQSKILSSGKELKELCQQVDDKFMLVSCDLV